MALATEIIGFLKFDDLAVREPQGIPVVGIVAVETPPSRHVV